MLNALRGEIARCAEAVEAGRIQSFSKPEQPIILGPTRKPPGQPMTVYEYWDASF